jgi:hypothetical protein
MLALAVSALVLSVGSAEQAQLTKAEEQYFASVRRSLVTITDGGQDVAVAVCIGPQGQYMAHKGSIRFPIMFGRLPSGRLTTLRQRSTDDSTQLTLLMSESPIPGEAEPVKISEDGSASTTLLAMLTTGPVRAQLVSTDRLGILKSSRKAIPLAEVKFEAPLSKVGGAPLFNSLGEFVGVLNATLPTPANETNQLRNTAAELPKNTAGFATSNVQFGPQVLTVGYAVGPSAIRKVVEGFLSPKREVEHAAIGVFLVDAPKNNGAEVLTVAKGSPAEQAGLQVGDIIIELAGKRIRSQIDYAKAIFVQTVGKQIELKVRRNGETLTINVTPRESLLTL